MTTGYVTFELGSERYAVPMADVREIVRLRALRPLPGMRPPLAGVLDLRGRALSVLDIRPSGGSGDVLVLESAVDADLVGVAVDRVLAVLGEDEPAVRRAAGGRKRNGQLPDYVIEVWSEAGAPVFVVDVRRMFEVAPAQVQT